MVEIWRLQWEIRFASANTRTKRSFSADDTFDEAFDHLFYFIIIIIVTRMMISGAGAGAARI